MAKNWYIIHTYSGFEKKVAETLRSRIDAEALRDKFGEIMIPTEEAIEMRKGKKVVAPKLFYPGYVLVEMEMSNDTWHLVRSTPRVTGFLGSGPTPVPLTPDDVDRILHRVEVAAEHPKPKLRFDKCESVKVTLGPHGVNIMEFCKQFNAKTAAKDQDGLIIPVVLTIYHDRTFTFITKNPPASVLLKRAAGIAKGSGEPNKTKVGKVTAKQVEEIAKLKMPDLNARDLAAAVQTVRGTARSMGIEIES